MVGRVLRGSSLAPPSSTPQDTAGHEGHRHRVKSLEYYPTSNLQPYFHTPNKPRSMPSIVTGSGLSLDLYSREAHRQRSLEMYSSSGSSRQASATRGEEEGGEEEDASMAISHRLQKMFPIRHQRLHNHWRRNYNETLPSDFPLVLEHFLLPTNLLAPPASSGATPGHVPSRRNRLQAELPDNVMSVSGSSISPPPEALGFARRRGKFRASSSGSLDVPTPSVAVSVCRYVCVCLH